MRIRNNGKIRIWKAALLLLLAVIFAAAVKSEPIHAATRNVTMKSCKLNASGKKLTVKAKVKTKTKAMGKKLYLLGLNANASESGKKSNKPLASVKTKKGTITFRVNYSDAMLYQKFVVAYKKNKKYTIVSDARYITNPEVLASYTGKGPTASSKKGLQVEELSDSLEIGTQHAVINWTLNSLLNNKAIHKTEFTYKGKTYYFDADQLQRNDEQVQAYNAAGVRVSVILLLPKDSASAGTASMQFGGTSITKFSSFKTSTSAGCRTFEAAMTYLAMRYGTKENLVCGWILGNEVNSAVIWNYGGGKSLDTYMANYARAFRICYNAVKSVSKNSRVYISLDNNWNKDLDGKGKQYFSAKATVDKFYEKLKAQGKISFQIAFHAYPQGMSDPIFWDDTQATSSKNTPIINFKNIKVLTSYAKNNFGKNCTVMLSEQSFNSSRGQEVQAAAYAYAYYISESNSRIEAFIYGREFDHPDEIKSGYNWGLCDNWHSKRLIWSVFQYIDTANSFDFTDPLLKYTNLKKWNKISGFNRSKFTKKASKLKKAAILSIVPASSTSLTLTWEKLNTGDGYEIYRDGVQIATITGNSTVTYTDKKLNTGSAHQYQVRMFKNAPGKKLYGTFSDVVWASVTAAKAEINEKNCEVDGNTIKIAWKKMSDVSGYEIYRSMEQNGTYTLLAAIAADKTSYKDSDTVAGTTYYYKVRAYAQAGGANCYGEFSATTAQVAKIQLTVSIADGKVVLSWTKWPGTDRYRIYCKPKAATKYTRITTVNGLTYSGTQYKDDQNQMKDFVIGESYSFRIRADFGDGTYSKWCSNVVEIVIDGQINPVGIFAETETEDESLQPETETEGDPSEPETETEGAPSESETETEGDPSESETETGDGSSEAKTGDESLESETETGDGLSEVKTEDRTLESETETEDGSSEAKTGNGSSELEEELPETRTETGMEGELTVVKTK